MCSGSIWPWMPSRLSNMADEKALSFLRLIRRAQRGKLKVYLGYGAGVGKTWQMLQEGHRLLKEGVDVVVGLVETHGREETAKLLPAWKSSPGARCIIGASFWRRWTWTRSWRAGPRSPWWTNWPTPTSPEARMPNAIKMWKISWPREFMSSAPSTSSTWRAYMTPWRPRSG